MPSVDEYLKNIDEPQRAELERIRDIVKHTVPEANETVAYGMPAFKYKKQPLIYYAAFKDHMSIFPTNEPIDAVKDKLSEFKISKGTIQFTREKPLPESLIKELLAHRLKQIDRRPSTIR